jgi:translation initiation factor 2D
MFKKKPSVSCSIYVGVNSVTNRDQIKALSPLRSSDRRKLADQIIADLDISHSKLAEDASADQKAAHSAELTVLRNSILPENALSAKFTTTHGPDLQQVSGTVYVGTHQGDEQRILWVKIGNSLFPTG